MVKLSSKEYNIEDLWVIHKIINKKREIFICRRTDRGLEEIFTNSIIPFINKKDYITPLTKYYKPVERLYCSFYNKKELLQKYNEINLLDFIRNYSLKKNYNSDIEYNEEFFKWYQKELLKTYYLNKIFIVKEEFDGKEIIHLCKYNIVLRRYIDIFTNYKVDNIKIKYILSDYLKENNVKCDCQKLNIYELLKLYHEINIFNDFLRFDNVEDLVIKELNNRNLYEKSKIYKQKQRKRVLK